MNEVSEINRKPKINIIRWMPLALVSFLAILMIALLISTANASAQASSPATIDPAQLYRSFKDASTHRIAPTETFTYTIGLINSSTVTPTWVITDVVPVELNYVPGTATMGGVYDAQTRTLTWTGISVPVADHVTLYFKATPAIVVTDVKVVTNVATITVAGYQMKPETRIALVPEAFVGDTEKPVVKSVTIGDQDVLTDPSTTIHIVATDNVGVKFMYIREWGLTQTPRPHWMVVQSSGWVPYQADVPWKLGSANGVHFVGVWVADGALNVSKIDQNAVDFASLVLPDATYATPTLVPYLVFYKAGTKVSVTLTPSAGNADLFVWFPGNFLLPDVMSTNPGLTVDSADFTAPKDGVYIILVWARESATTYNLAITPGGGPGWITAGATSSVISPSTNVTGQPEVLPFEFPFTQSGLDPVASTSDPFMYQIYLPLTVR